MRNRIQNQSAKPRTTSRRGAVRAVSAGGAIPVGYKADQQKGRRTFSKRSLHGRVAHAIGLGIVRGEFAPGTALPSEAVWSEQLGISRTALREAIKVLAAKGMISSQPKTGTRVRPREDWNFLDPDVLAWRLSTTTIEAYVKELFQLRRMIEPAAAALAAEHAEAVAIQRLEQAFGEMALAGDDGVKFEEPDRRFHQSILRMTGNELIGSLGALIETALLMTFRLSNDNPRGQRHSLPLHRDVLSAISANNPEAAHKAMERLLTQSEGDVRQAIAASRRRGRRPQILPDAAE
jgi:DNA-binding FadR family transcriptional regulator